MNNLSYLIKQGIRSVWKNRFMSFASLCIMTVSLILVGMSAIVMLDCGIILDNVSDKNEISVYLNDDADIKHIGEVLKSNTRRRWISFPPKKDSRRWSSSTASRRICLRIFRIIPFLRPIW